MWEIGFKDSSIYTPTPPQGDLVLTIVGREVVSFMPHSVLTAIASANLYMFQLNLELVYRRSHFDALHLSELKMYKTPRAAFLRTDDTLNITRKFGGKSSCFLYFLFANTSVVDFLGKLNWRPSTIETLELNVKNSAWIEEFDEVETMMHELHDITHELLDRFLPFPIHMEVPGSVKHVLMKRLHDAYVLSPKGGYNSTNRWRW